MAAGRDHKQRWRRRPWIWAGSSFLLFLLFAALNLTDVPSERAFDRDAWHLTAQIESNWNHGDRVPVTYRRPDTGAVAHGIAIQFASDRLPRRIGPVRVRVEKSPAPDIHLDAPIRPVEAPVFLWVGVFLAGSFSVAGLFRLFVARRSERLAAQGGPVTRFDAVPRPGRWRPRRWRLELYDPASPVGGSARAVIHVIGSDASGIPRAVDVVGAIQPGRIVAVREVGTGRMWWPTGPVYEAVWHRRPEPDPIDVDRRGRAGWILLAIGIASCMFALSLSGESALSVENRSARVRAVVVSSMVADEGPVEVQFVVDDVHHRATIHLAGPQEARGSVVLMVDRSHPNDVWSPGISMSPRTRSDSAAGGFGSWGAMFIALGLVGIRRPRSAKERNTEPRHWRPVGAAMDGPGWDWPSTPAGPPGWDVPPPVVASGEPVAPAGPMAPPGWVPAPTAADPGPARNHADLLAPPPPLPPLTPLAPLPPIAGPPALAPATAPPPGEPAVLTEPAEDDA